MATKLVAWQTGNGNITLTYNGQGDGPITVQSDQNDLATARSQTIVIETTAGSPVVTKNLTVTQPACPIPVGTVKNYGYTDAVQEVYLPAGRYKLQCWGAQGGSNAAAPSYGITAKAGGKGGYSEGVITLTSPTTLKIYVGGAGGSSAGGFNGGGSTSGSASYSSGDTQGVSRMGGGGGATDIRLSDGALLSRMIVAGGGSGGAMCYRKVTSSTNKNQTVNWTFQDNSGTLSNVTSYSASDGNASYSSDSSANLSGLTLCLDLSSYINKFPLTVTFTVSSAGGSAILRSAKATNRTLWDVSYIDEFVAKGSGTGNKTIVMDDTSHPILFYYCSDNKPGMSITGTGISWSETSTSESNSSQVGYAGGGTTGAGYSSTYQGKQNGAGSNGSFGQGANQTATNYRYCSGAGGGGWYGGGMQYSDSDMNACKMSGGGSGFVNTAANAGNRPSGYTGLELDSGSTVAGNTSFEAPGGGTETGHSGNGYARITRLS